MKIKVNKMYIDIVDSFRNAKNATIEDCKMRSKNKVQNWWSKELEKMKKVIKEARKEYKVNNNVDNKLRVKKFKKEFRKLQRRNIYIYENGKNKNIENLFNIGNKEAFWKAFGSFKSRDSFDVSNKEEKEKEMSEINACFNHFGDLFYKNFETVNTSEQQKEIICEVNKWKETCKSNFFKKDKIYINSKTIIDCINDMKTSNTQGYDGISNNMIKKTMKDRLIVVLKDFFNSILCTGVIPDNLNRSIIIPIVKDKNKKIFDVNNLRPISVSNCLAQMLERIILYQSKFLYETSANQFGFQIDLSAYIFIKRKC